MVKKQRHVDSFILLTLSAFVAEGVVGSYLVSVMEGESVTLKSNVTKQGNDKMLWYFNDTLIALINGDPNKSCLYDGEGGIFRGILKVEFETGSLTITDIRPEHTGRFEGNFIRSKDSGTSQSLNRNGKCDSTKVIKKKNNIGDTVKTFSVMISELYNVEKKQERERNSVQSVGFVARICVGASVGVILLLAAAVLGVIYYRNRTSKMEDIEKNKFEHLLNVPV